MKVNRTGIVLEALVCDWFEENPSWYLRTVSAAQPDTKTLTEVILY